VQGLEVGDKPRIETVQGLGHHLSLGQASWYGPREERYNVCTVSYGRACHRCRCCSFNHGAFYFIIPIPLIFCHSDFDLILGCSLRDVT